ncbi:hypothetical protein Tco_0927974, partial [Tanacetum coccineum]
MWQCLILNSAAHYKRFLKKFPKASNQACCKTQVDKDDSTTALPTAYGSIPLPHQMMLPEGSDGLVGPLLQMCPRQSEARSISTFVQLLQSQINNSNGSSLVDMGPIKSYAVGRDKRKQLLLMSCQHAADRLEVWAQPVNTLSSVCKAAEMAAGFPNALAKGSSKSFPKHETRHVAEHQ